MKASVNSIETMSTIDGPGLRTVIFLNGCGLRCKYCHNPETWHVQALNYTSDEILKKILNNKPYFKNGGGVTFSGGEPLLQSEFLLDILPKLKKENIHIALDTALYGGNNLEEVLKNTDLLIYDIKDITKDGYYDLTSGKISNTWDNLEIVRKLHTKLWIRLVIVPGIHDSESYLKKLVIYIKEHFNREDILKIEFIPYHTLGKEKYEPLGLTYPLDINDMDQTKCQKLYDKFIKMYDETLNK